MNCELHGEFEPTIVMDPFVPERVMFRSDKCRKCMDIEREQKDREAAECAQVQADLKRAAHLAAELQRANVPKLREGYGFGSYPLESVPAEHKDKAVRVIAALGRWCEALPQLQAAALDGNAANGLWVALVGSMGSGKTGLAYAVAIDAVNRGIGAGYFTATGIVSYIWDAKFRGSCGSAALEELIECELLIIDDVGIKGAGENESAQITEILDGRYRNKLATMVISNGKKHEVQAILGDRITDRFDELGIWLRCDWPSLRGRHNQVRVS